ncbi:MAG: acetyltransferase [Phycisphaeraceae bacterium]|nr:acetyltransferase [Phycisphaerales bacterium]MCB9860173.1 acetyltransferase [Phycisphaeraceae bacterium]
MPHAGALVIIGGGGHAVVVLEAAKLNAVRVFGFYDDDPTAPLNHGELSASWLGTMHDVASAAGQSYILGVGDIALRQTLMRQLDRISIMPTTIIHPSAQVAHSAIIEPGVYVGPQCVVHARARVDAHAIINSGAIIEHDCEIGVNTHIGPRACIGGGVHVGDNTLIGLGASIIPGISVGSDCTIGAGAVVIRDVPVGSTVVGVPAKPIHHSQPID